RLSPFFYYSSILSDTPPNKVLATDAKLKFVFFMCPNFELGRQPQLEKEDVIVWALKGANAI
ncbi:MAG: hypothetical protein L0J53_07480, partial [Psychrobacter sp.]|nr:hypothetical protein [Psychrobacter sp.]